MPPTLRLGGAYVSAAYRHLGVTRFEHHRDPGRVRRGGCERGLILGFGLWRGLMLDRLPVLGQPAPHALDQRNRIRSEFRRRHLIERFAADAEKVGELLVGQSEKAHPIRAVGKLRSISTRTPNAARRAIRLASAGLCRTRNKSGFPRVLHHRDTRSYVAPFPFHVEWKGSNQTLPRNNSECPRRRRRGP